jgi:lipopolysaccharide biosynthesis regulator YciM
MMPCKPMPRPRSSSTKAPTSWPATPKPSPWPTARAQAGKPRQLVEKALKLDPKHGHSLFLAGAAAMEAGDNKKGIAYWEALLPQVEPGSEIDQMLRSGIDKMKQAK